MVIFFVAILKIGATCAFVNYQLRGEGFVHSIKISSAKLALFQHTLANSVKEILHEFGPDQKFVAYHARGSSAPCEVHVTSVTEEELDSLEATKPDQQLTDAGRVYAVLSLMKQGTQTLSMLAAWGDPAVLIYTSGTTGLPKAAIVP